ncbi:von Willebrand factor type A domain-containing protein [Sedimentitalea sp. HM32M-2]|uniref:YfbK domain-containing protein n=1 Tax=Sedimentitalea sp. HM32M-2 TaxID=3351566 RepID=UPI003634E2CC
MNDDLNDLRAAMRAATPDPDADAKKAHLALARKNFATFQESRAGVRPMSDRPKPGPWTGVRQMLIPLTSRAGLTATTAIIAVALVTLTPIRDTLLPPDVPLLRQVPAPTPATAPENGLPAELLEMDDRTATAAPKDAPMTAPMAEPAQALTDNLARGRTAKSAARVLGASPPGAALETAIAPPPPMPDRMSPQAEGESYANADANPLNVTAETPVSTFSIDVDTASYAVLRNSLMAGRMPAPDAVRIEEMVNYFPYAYPRPEGDQAFRPTVSVLQTPWNADTRLVHIGIQGAVPAAEDRPPLNLVFLIDTSGSMDQPAKLGLLKQSFALMLGQLREQDQVAIVTYAGSAGQVLAPTAASDRGAILAALNALNAGGSTAGQAGLQQAYAIAAGMAEDGEVSRVILATDGDFNVGLSDPEALKHFISEQRDGGTYLSVLGFGRGNLDDATMQALAQNGNGQAAYIDTLAEAQKVLVDQLSGALFPIADDVKIQVEFNPATVAEYRLIGYETRALRREDFNNDRVDAGDIGAGHALTALYEITPVGSPAQLSDPLRYRSAPAAKGARDELGYLRLRYKSPGNDTSRLIEQAITVDMPAGTDTGFAAAIAGFGQVLRGDDTYLGDWDYDQAIALANANRGADPYGYRTEAVRLMRLAKSLSAQ